jgi:hypothetical protein
MSASRRWIAAFGVIIVAVVAWPSLAPAQSWNLWHRHPCRHASGGDWLCLQEFAATSGVALTKRTEVRHQAVTFVYNEFHHKSRDCASDSGKAIHLETVTIPADEQAQGMWLIASGPGTSCRRVKIDRCLEDGKPVHCDKVLIATVSSYKGSMQ